MKIILVVDGYLVEVEPSLTTRIRFSVPFDENPAVDTVAEHLDVYHVLAPQLSPEQKLEHARRIVDAVLALQVKP
jgi:hypothetical protein